MPPGGNTAASAHPSSPATDWQRFSSTALPLLAAHTMVRLAWSWEMHGGEFRGRAVDGVKEAEWQTIAAGLKSGV